MTPFALTSGHIRHEDLAIFNKMKSLVERLPNSSISGTISCHHVCHALSRALGVEVVDGFFGHCDHSWISLGIHDGGEVVADMYPVATATPFLVFTARLTPWSDLYKKNPEKLERVTKKPQFKRELAEITLMFRRLNTA